ncbi:MAG: hypothetical protein EXS38_09260 [Opitutus sp.]|nr:hypothetical protein [Opitutus sp.]
MRKRPWRGANINGMNGGYLGVALDEYGNFSSASEGRVGGLGGTTGLVPDSIGVRGTRAGPERLCLPWRTVADRAFLLHYWH